MSTTRIKTERRGFLAMLGAFVAIPVFGKPHPIGQSQVDGELLGFGMSYRSQLRIIGDLEIVDSVPFTYFDVQASCAQAAMRSPEIQDLVDGFGPIYVVSRLTATSKALNHWRVEAEYARRTESRERDV